MTAISITQPREPAAGKWWWVLLVTGILWILIGLYVLQAHYGSAVAIGYLVGFWLLFAGVAEFIEIGAAARWKWVHVALGVLFVVGGIAALTAPFQTFTVLASLVGFFLIIKGTFDFVLALALTPRDRPLVADVDRRDHPDRARDLGDRIPRPFRRAAPHLGRYRRHHPGHRRDRGGLPRAQASRGGGRMKVRLVVLTAVIVASALGLASCSTQARAERKGKEAGEQICKAKDADNANEAQRHINRANDKLNDLARFTGRDVRQDVRGLDRNLDQMARGNATQQDVSAVTRNVENARAAAQGNAVAAYDGILEALANCE